jgi:hypothetical protein
MLKQAEEERLEQVNDKGHALTRSIEVILIQIDIFIRPMHYIVWISLP